MRILHLEASSGWGGQEMRILREAEGMRARGHVVILAVSKGGGLVKRAKDAGFTVYELSFKKISWLGCLFKLARIIKKNKIDVVNTHSSLDSWIGGITARVCGKKIIRTRHLSTPIKAGWNSVLVYGKLADFVVTTCASIVPMIIRQAGKSEKVCRSIATGVNPASIQVKAEESLQFRKSLSVSENDFLVGTACFMRSWKGIFDLLQAADLLREVPNLKWVVIGGGHAEVYRQKAKELNLEDILYFTGHLDNPFPALGALDAFMLLSTAHEGVSQAILQAAYLEKPLIATATGGLGEVCIDQETGIRVGPFSPFQVASAVKTLKANPELCRKLGARAKKLVEEKFTLAHTLDEMEKVYKNMFEN
jgi:glycosyltransferase involved in cell wall biosynthesis